MIGTNAPSKHGESEKCKGYHQCSNYQNHRVEIHISSCGMEFFRSIGRNGEMGVLIDWIRDVS